MRRSAPGESRLSADNQSCVVGKLATQTLRTGDLGCPAGVVELRQPQVVQPRRPQSGPAELTTDHFTAVGELPADGLLTKQLIIARGGAVAPTPQQAQQ